MITVISYNIRYDKPDPDEHNWRNRRDAVADLLSSYGADIIGTQEGRANQLLDLHRLLPQYQSVGSDRRGTGLDEYCAILYRPDRLQCLESGQFWLSETPEVVASISESWGNPYPRIVTWARFLTSESKEVLFYNTHLDYYSEIAKDLGAKLIHERFCQLDLTDRYLFLTGDFNVGSDCFPRRVFLQPLKDGHGLEDALGGLGIEERMSFNNYTDTAFKEIDTIYHDRRLSLKWAKVDASRRLGIIPSDHYPVIASFEFP